MISDLCKYIVLIPFDEFNPYLTYEFSHHYKLGESTFIFRCVIIRCDFYLFFFISFFDEISLCKQNSQRWDAALCGVTSGAMLFADARLI